MIELIVAGLLSNLPCIYPLKPQIFGQREYQFVEMKTNGERLNLLVDTGEPTFFVSTEAFGRLGGPRDVEIDIEHGLRSGTPDDFTRVETLPMQHAYNQRCGVRPIKGGVIDHNAVERLALDGAISPSQFAWGGCIHYDLNKRVILKVLHARQQSCPINMERQPTIVLDHKYVTELKNPAGHNRHVLFDTGLGQTTFHVSFFDDSNIELIETRATVTDRNGTHPVYTVDTAFDLEIGMRTIKIDQPFVVTKEKIRDHVSATIGMDLLKNAEIIVGISNPPEIYFD